MGPFLLSPSIRMGWVLKCRAAHPYKMTCWFPSPHPRDDDRWFIPNSSQDAFYQYVGSGQNGEDGFWRFGKHQGPYL